MNDDKDRAGLVVLAVDDERPVLDELAYLLDADDHVRTVLTASDASEALRILEAGPGAPAPDAVFLDIGMPGLNGLELARVCSGMAAPPSVVFVTADEDRAIDAYEVGAVDYLLKPIRSERLGAALERIVASRSRRDPDDDDVIPSELAGTTTLVARSAVCHVEAQGDYVRLHTHDGPSHLARLALSTLQDRWQDAGFLRVHRSHLVAVRCISAVRRRGTGYVVRIGHGHDAVELPVSRRHVRDVHRRVRGGWRDHPAP